MHRPRPAAIAVLVLTALGTVSACAADQGGSDQPSSPSPATTAVTAPPSPTTPTAPGSTTTPPPAAATPSPAPTRSVDVENPTDLDHGAPGAPTRPAH
ncbi:hypothetical protein ABTY61_32695 [Kitasatospora sp. NPDC096128]|uniref:hypothetical protein n=1 Tax=Kitasatospora sp. NPDC096128 TaxID=3155547 RepID=UPI00331968DB